LIWPTCAQNLMTSFSRSTDIIGAPAFKIGQVTMTMPFQGDLSSVGWELLCSTDISNLKSLSFTFYEDRKGDTKSKKSSAVAEMGDRGHNRHGPKREGCCALFAGAGTPSSTMWPVPRSTAVPSGVFIHPAI